jgi:hypothetical protein
MELPEEPLTGRRLRRDRKLDCAWTPGGNRKVAETDGISALAQARGRNRAVRAAELGVDDQGLAIALAHMVGRSDWINRQAAQISHYS